MVSHGGGGGLEGFYGFQYTLFYGFLADFSRGGFIWAAASVFLFSYKHWLVCYISVAHSGNEIRHCFGYYESRNSDTNLNLHVFVRTLQEAHAQAAITRMTHDEPGPGQTYARKAIAALRVREPSVEVEIRWCPAHKKGSPGTRSRMGWAKQAASEPDDRGIEWLTLANGDRLPSPP